MGNWKKTASEDAYHHQIDKSGQISIAHYSKGEKAEGDITDIKTIDNPAPPSSFVKPAGWKIDLEYSSLGGSGKHLYKAKEFSQYLQEDIFIFDIPGMGKLAYAESQCITGDEFIPVNANGIEI